MPEGLLVQILRESNPTAEIASLILYVRCSGVVRGREQRGTSVLGRSFLKAPNLFRILIIFAFLNIYFNGKNFTQLLFLEQTKFFLGHSFYMEINEKVRK